MKTSTEKNIFKLLLLLWLIPVYGYSQENPMPNATFIIVSQLDQVTGDTIKYDGVFRVGPDKLGWGASLDELTIFNVESSVGKWKKKKNKGLIVYNVSFAQAVGTVRLIGEKNLLIIEIVIELEGGTIKNKLFATSVRYL